MPDLLGTTLILLVACSLAAALTARLKIPTLLGYLLVGVLLGPPVTAWIMPGPALNFLAELGVALLLFMVGLEFSLGHFWLTRRTVLVAGALQMAMVAAPVALALLWLGLPPDSAALLGAAAAMSSTALVSRQLADQGELTTRHGRSAIAVLVFQDLASVPLLALLAIWARGDAPGFGSVLGEVAGVLLLFAVSALASRRLLHGLLGWVARQGHEESFVLVSLSLVVAAAAAAHALGVSAALGAFLAGMVLGESDYRHHMESHLKPFRDVLSGLFFVTIGLQLDVAQIVAAPLAVLGWLLALVPLKMGLNFLALRATRLSALDAWRTGIVLGHGGEFALLLLGMVMQQHLIAATVVQPMLVALVLSMGLAPLLIRHHDRWAQALSHSGALGQPPQAEEGEVAERARSLRHPGRSRIGPCPSGGADVCSSADGRAHCASGPRTPSGLSVMVSCRQLNEGKRLQALPNVHVHHETFAAALGLAEQVLQLGGVSVAAANQVLNNIRNELNGTDLARSNAS